MTKITIERETLQAAIDALECALSDSRPYILKSRESAAALRAALEVQPAEPDEIEQLRADLISCRGTVKTELNHYERLAGVHGKTPHGAAYEAEAQRLDALLDRIDAMMKDKP